MNINKKEDEARERDARPPMVRNGKENRGRGNGVADRVSWLAEGIAS